jgi:hypothetical protein
VALFLWLVRPAVSLLAIDGVGSHSHPVAEPPRCAPTPGCCHCARLRLSSPRHEVHPDPFWPQYLRMVAGWPWPGDYRCPLVPQGTVEERPAWRGEMVSADEY